MNFLQTELPRIDAIKNLYQPFEVTVDVLRLDLVHPIVSGNKWYKLKEYIKEARQQNKKTILTFGGAFSNHIIATAAACKEAGLETIGVIRGEQVHNLSHTLKDAKAAGMNLFFTSREEYKNKIVPQQVWQQFAQNETYIINEGGYGIKGKVGAQFILDERTAGYNYIIAAIGTGTTLAGLVGAARQGQKVMGISVLKNHQNHSGEINALLPRELHNQFEIFNQFHFGGYAKFNNDLMNFMNEFYHQTGIPTDFVYTGKLFFALEELIKSGIFPKKSNILAIHSGGLQGNRSLPKGTLIF